jgi:hypothetical protein
MTAVGSECVLQCYPGQERNHAHPVEARQRDVADGRRHLPGEVKLARLAKGHGLAGIEEDAHRQLALLLVELEE